MRKFDKNKQLRKLHNRKNNSNTKIITIVLSVTILIGAIIYFTFARFESNQSYNLMSGIIVEPYKTIAQTMVKLKEAGSTELIYDGTDTLGERGTADNNLRYIGSNPNNYIYYNCTTEDPNEMNDDTCEKWRIIGMMNHILLPENGHYWTKVKIIRNESIGSHLWAKAQGSNNLGYGLNQWGKTSNYDGSELYLELNNVYNQGNYDASDSAWNINGAFSQSLNTSLSESARSMVEKVLWDNSSPNNENNDDVSSDDTKMYVSKIYKHERGKTSTKICASSQACNDTVQRAPSASAHIGLIYISDYMYATGGGNTISQNDCYSTALRSWYNNDCTANNWLNYPQNYWALAPMSNNNNAYVIYYIKANGGISTFYSTSSQQVRPSLYLKDNIYIYSGDGSENNPYKLIQK